MTRCRPPSRQLDGRQAEPAAADQQAAIDELEKIWDAVIPFHALLARDLADQTKIAASLAPPPAPDSKAGTDEPSGEKDPQRDETKPGSKGPSPPGTGHAALGHRKRRPGAAHGSAGADAPPDAIAQAQGRGRTDANGKVARARRGPEGA